jgi:hypothetical protein
MISWQQAVKLSMVTSHPPFVSDRYPITGPHTRHSFSSHPLSKIATPLHPPLSHALLCPVANRSKSRPNLRATLYPQPDPPAGHPLLPLPATDRAQAALIPVDRERRHCVDPGAVVPREAQGSGSFLDPAELTQEVPLSSAPAPSAGLQPQGVFSRFVPVLL